jgi:hypothetical protein
LVAGVSKTAWLEGGMNTGGVHGLDGGTGAGRRRQTLAGWGQEENFGGRAAGRQGAAGMAGGTGTARDGVRPWPVVQGVVS